MKKIIVLILGVFLLSGCMTSRFDISRPLAGQDKSLVANDGDLNYQNKLEISLKPCNFSNAVSLIVGGTVLPKRYLYKGEKVFYVEVGFKPRVDGFTFDPSSVIFKTDNFTLTPSAVYGPLSTKEIYLNSLFKFEESKKFIIRKNIDLSTLSGSISLDANKWTGVLLKYDAYPPLPESNFSLILKGLQSSGESLDLNVDFTKSSVMLMDDL